MGIKKEQYYIRRQHQYQPINLAPALESDLIHPQKTGHQCTNMFTINACEFGASFLVCIHHINQKLAHKQLPAVPARGGAEVALKIYIRPFSSIELACAVRQPSPCVRALCEAVAVLSKMTCATPVQCNGKRRLSSHFTLPSSHFKLDTSSHLRSCELFSPHLTSSQLFSSHPIASHMSSKKVLLNCFHLIRALINLSHLLEFVLNSSVLWILNPVSSQTLNSSCVLFFTIPFFAWHHTETVLFLHQTPLKLHVFTSEVSRTQNPARCRSWAFFISLWILGNNHALITRPALARAPWQWASCTRKHQRCNSRSSLSRQRTLKISLELPGAHSLGLFFAIKFHHKNICKTRIPSAVRATHCGKLHVWFSRLEAFRSSCCKASSQEGHIDKEEAMARGSKTGLSCPQAMQRWFSSAFVTRNKWWQRASNSFMVSTSMMRGIAGKILLQKSRCLRYRWSCKIASAVARQTQANGQCWWLCNSFKVTICSTAQSHGWCSCRICPNARTGDPLLQVPMPLLDCIFVPAIN